MNGYKAHLLSGIDVFAGPILIIILLMIFSIIVRKYDDKTKSVFLNAFYYKMVFTVIYSLIMQYYYHGGDTEMYYDCTMDLCKAVGDSSHNVWTIYTTNVVTVKSPLMNYFLFDGSVYPNFEAMHNLSNFLIPKLGLPIALVFGKSYLCMALVFAFFGLGGAIRMYKFFMQYFPDYRREIAFAVLFLPSVCFWSSGYLKDPICFGSVGYMLYGLHSIFIRRKKFISSICWVVVSAVFLFNIKVYILLALVPGIVLWIFGEVNKLVENKTLRRIMALITFTAGGIIGFLLINYVSSDESAKSYQLDTLLETSKYNRALYEGFSQNVSGAYYTIKTDNPVLLVLNGIVATLFRPFLWDVSSPIVLFSALEAFIFTYFTIILWYKRGFINFFRRAFKDPIFVMSIVFTLIFAAAIGSSATNFGSLSRYKIPCLPFFLIMVLVMYRQAGLEYPDWFNKLLGYKIKPKKHIRRVPA